MTIASAKAEARKAAFQRRAGANPDVAESANKHLVDAVRAAEGSVVSAYWPIRTELDPRRAMFDLSETHEVCLPVVLGAAQPLGFRPWSPGAAMMVGAFDVEIPVESREAVPDILIVPLAAFDPDGYRLGYGGGFYDRTIEHLSAQKAITAIGFAFDVQESAVIPREATDQKLDVIVTESGIRRFS